MAAAGATTETIKLPFSAEQHHQAFAFKDDAYDPETGIGSVAYAVIRGQQGRLKRILTPDNATQVDKCGFTPMFYACALRDTESMRLLQEAQKVKVVLDIYHHFPSWRAIFEPDLPTGETVVCKDESGTAVTAATFRQRTGAQFYDGITATQNAWIAHISRQWDDVEVRSERLTGWLKEKYDPENFPDIRLSDQDASGWGVVAGEAIAAGRIVGSYGGEIGTPATSEYRFQDIDGTRTRNLIPHVADGFPNCVFHPIPLEDGRFLPIMFALRDIAKDEPLTVNYDATHPVKLGVHAELQLERMTEYFRDHPIDTAQERLSEASDFRDCLKKYEHIAAVEYVLGTPSSLLILCLKGLVPFNYRRRLTKDHSGVREVNALIDRALSLYDELVTAAPDLADDMIEDLQETSVKNLCDHHEE